ncbi:MAG: hypothetical protein KJ621_18445 [Proteobacteria bacterium]|nr:hypothetical protein [Pseudomonadota bacterium]MBU1740866.1 hypothetical protein [Pseudomonadota bacterium]
MIRLNSVAAALVFYFERMAAGDARALPLEPKEDAHAKWTPNPSPFHDALLLVGVIGRLLRTAPWVDGQGRRHRPLLNQDELRLLFEIYAGPGGTTRRLAVERAQWLADVEIRLARAMLQAGVIRADQLLDGQAEVRTYLGVDARTLGFLTRRYPMRRVPGQRLQTLIPWVEAWIDDLPREWRRNWRRWGRLQEMAA